MKKVLIFGSGSIGNHMAFACRKIGLEVYITDASKKALKRMKDKIYPSRYGFWDNKIKQINLNDCDKLKEKFDLIIIGTPISSVIAIRSDTVDIYIIGSEMNKKGWNLNILQNLSKVFLTQNY